MKKYQTRIANYKEYMEVAFEETARHCKNFPGDDRGGFFRSYVRVMQGINEAAGLEIESKMLELAIFERIRKEIEALEAAKESLRDRNMIA